MQRTLHDVIVPLAFASLVVACERAPAQPDAGGAPAFAAVAGKKAPEVRAALRTGRECGATQSVCMSYNIVSVSVEQNGTLVEVDPSIDLTKAVILVTPDTLPVIPMLSLGYPPPTSRVFVSIVDPGTGTASGYQQFSMVVF